MALFALACATPPSDEELDAQLRTIAAEVKPRGELRVVSINAESRMDAWTKLADDEIQGKEHGPSQQARRLARAFEKAAYVAVADVILAKMAGASRVVVRPPDPEARRLFGVTS